MQISAQVIRLIHKLSKFKLKVKAQFILIYDNTANNASGKNSKRSDSDILIPFSKEKHISLFMLYILEVQYLIQWYTCSFSMVNINLLCLFLNTLANSPYFRRHKINVSCNKFYKIILSACTG